MPQAASHSPQRGGEYFLSGGSQSPIVARDDAKAILTELRQSAVTSHPL